jgi:hypothetical protein
MPRTETFKCPLSGLSVTLDIDTDPVTYESPDEDERTPPEGWGEVQIRQYVRNPEWIAVEADRAEAIGDAEASFAAGLADPATPADERAQIEAARENLADALDLKFPFPASEWVWKITTFAPLAPDTLEAAADALTAAGFK